MNTKYLVLLALILGFKLVVAQTYNPLAISPNTLYYDMDRYRKGAELKSYSEIRGNPYYREDFNECLVYCTDGKVCRGQLRYDIYADDMQFNKEDKLFAIEKEKVDSIIFSDEKFVCREAILGNTIGKSYFILLQDGRFQLLLKKNMQFLPKEPARPYVQPQPDRFESLDDSYFIRFADKPAVSIYNQNSLDKAFPQIAGKEDSFIKSAKIKFSKKSDLIKLTRFLNSLN
jgi:hypothetical protein